MLCVIVVIHVYVITYHVIAFWTLPHLYIKNKYIDNIMMNSLICFLLMLSNVYAFIYGPLFTSHNKLSRGFKTHTIEMSGEYLDNINNYSSFLNKAEDPKTKKLRRISRNIDEWMKNTSKSADKKIEKGRQSTYSVIPKATFDTIFINIYQIQKIYMSSNFDRVIFELSSTGMRYVYYVNNKDDESKMNQLMKLIPNHHKICIINDWHNVMDDPFGYLYCEKK